MRPLTARERAFVDAFVGIAKHNATKAAIIGGYSRKTPRQAATRLLSKAHIQAAIERRVVRREAQTNLTNEYIDKQVRALAEHAEDERTQLGAWKELNKVRGRHSVTINLRDKSFEDLLAASRQDGK